jgi:hypothetical protein
VSASVHKPQGAIVKASLMIGCASAIVGLGAPAWAQAPAAAPDQTPGARAQQVQARFQIAAMEGVLERAVQLGAQNVRVKVQQVAPELLFINGAARARGFWLDGYGVFFDVDVPAIRRSLAWGLRVLDQSGRGVDAALSVLKQRVAAVSDESKRRELEVSVQTLERRIGPGTGGSLLNASASSGVAAAAEPEAPPQPSPEVEAVLEDPGLAYTNEVKAALVDAVIEYSAPFQLTPSDWLTVAARDQDGSRLQPGDPYDVSTMLIRVRGVDLAAYRAGQITKDEIRKRVEVKEY